jgi:peptidyl-prolyl cis-trans isomerase SurA
MVQRVNAVEQSTTLRGGLPPDRGRPGSRGVRAAGLATAVALAILLGSPATGPAVVINRILATVDGEPITVRDLQRFTQANVRGRQLGAANQAAVLDAVIMDRIVTKEASAQGLVVRDEDIDRYIAAIKERNHLTDEQLQQALEQQGMTMDRYRQQIREEIQRQQLVSREIGTKVTVTPEDIKQYYDSHRDEFTIADRMEVAHIVFILRPDAPDDQVALATAMAAAVRSQIEAGADFAAMAAKYTQDGSGPQGGTLGWFKTGELLEPLERAASQLKVGEVSQPVRTRVGVHLVKLLAREGKSQESLEEHAQEIKERLYAQALDERYRKWVDEDLRKRHHVEMH